MEVCWVTHDIKTGTHTVGRGDESGPQRMLAGCLGKLSLCGATFTAAEMYTVSVTKVRPLTRSNIKEVTALLYSLSIHCCLDIISYSCEFQNFIEQMALESVICVIFASSIDSVAGLGHRQVCDCLALTMM